MFTTPIRLFRSPEGDNLGPSLADLDTPSTTIQGGDGSQKLPSLTDPPPADAPPAGDQPPAGDTADDNKEPEGDGTEGDKPDVDGDEPAETTPEEFYGTVSKLTGIDVDVKWDEGVDPLSPEGVAVRDKAILEKGATDFDAYLKNTHPRAYAYFMHQQAGLPDEQFFNTAGSVYTLPDRAAMQDSVDLQTSVYKYQLLNQGLDEDTADAVVAKAIKDNKLLEKSSAAYGTIESTQAKNLEEAKAIAAEEDRKFKALVDNTKASINKQMTDLSFIVPEAQKPEFENFVMSNLRVIDGKVYIVQEVTEEQRKLQMEAQLFQWKKGDLSTVVKKAATTQATHRLRAQIKASQGGNKKDEGIGGSGKQSLPLSAI